MALLLVILLPAAPFIGGSRRRSKKIVHMENREEIISYITCHSLSRTNKGFEFLLGNCLRQTLFEAAGVLEPKAAYVCQTIPRIPYHCVITKSFMN